MMNTKEIFMFAAIIFDLGESSNLTFTDIQVQYPFLFSDFSAHSTQCISWDELHKSQDCSELCFSDLPFLLHCKKQELLFVSSEIDHLYQAKAANVFSVGYSPDSSFLPTTYCFETFEDLGYSYFDHIFHRYNKSPITITETPRLILRELSEQDLTSLFRIYQEPGLTTYMDEKNTDFEDFYGRMCSYISSVYSFFEYGMWGVFLKETGELIGECGIQSDVLDGQEEIQIGYLLSTPYQKKGMAKEMIQATLQYAHSTFSFQRIVAQILPNNTASIATAKSCHFRLEKRIKKADTAYYLYVWKPENSLPSKEHSVAQSVQEKLKDNTLSEVYKKCYKK